ncbi:MAG: hypothetical protein ABEJ02_03995 [Candidatus Paceibacteria bacterium]
MMRGVSVSILKRKNFLALLSLLSGSLLVLKLLFSFSFISIPLFLFWAITISFSFGLVFSSQSILKNFILGFLALFSCLGVFSVLFYFLFSAFGGLQVTLLVILITFLAIAASYEQSLEFSLDSFQYKAKPVWFYILLVAFIVSNLFLLFLFFQLRTEAGIVSPWLLPKFIFFALYFSSSFSLLYLLKNSWTNLSLCLSILYYLVSLLVAVIVYKVGFGFDPFIHRAAEKALFSEHIVKPQRVLYSGQYTLVVLLKHLTSVSIEWIDKLLVPLSSALVLPALGYLSFRDGWGMNKVYASIGSVLLLLFPYSHLTHTVPNNLSYFILFCVVLILPLLNKKNLYTHLILLALSIFSLLTHPLLGVIAVLLVVAGIVYDLNLIENKRIRRSVIILFVIFSLPVLFYYYNFNHGVYLLTKYDFVWQIKHFFSLFTNPTLAPFYETPIFWNLVWWYKLIGLVIFSILGFYFIGKRKNIWSKKKEPYLVVAVGIVLMLLLFSSLMRIPGVISYERSEFPLRVISALYLLALPLFILAVLRFHKNYVNTNFKEMSFFSAVSLFLLFSWYLSYAPEDPKSPHVSPAVSSSDVRVVKKIDRMAGGRPHVVLSNQMTAAAAIENLGFKNYITTKTGERLLWYPIPTGKKFYSYFRRFMKNPSKEKLIKAGKFAGVENVYLVLHDYESKYISKHEENGLSLFTTADNIKKIKDNIENIVIYKMLIN